MATNILSEYVIFIVFQGTSIYTHMPQRHVYLHTLPALSNLYLDIQFTPQRTKYFIRKNRPSVYCKNLTDTKNTVRQNALL